MPQRKAAKGQTVDPKFWENVDEFQVLARRDKAARLQAAFIETDTDGSGSIDAAELWALLQRAFPECSTKLLQVYYDVLMRECDLDQDGRIDYTEFSSYEQSQLMLQLIDESEKAEVLEKAFRDIDRDGSGQLDVGELEEVLRIAFPDSSATTRQKFVRAILVDCDKDYSGTVTIEEFLKSEYLHLLAYTGLGGEDLERKAKAAKRPPKVARVKRTKGVQGGIDARCQPTSPRKRGKDAPGAAAGGGVGGARAALKLPTVTRLEENNFVPSGIPGELLLAKGEFELENHAAAHQWNEAKEDFADAGQQYIAEGDYGAAGDAFLRAADCLGKLGQPLESAENLVKAAEAYAVARPSDAIDAINEALEIYEDFERMKTVARLHKRLAEISEGMGSTDQAIGYYLEAADLYLSDNNLPLQVQCLRKVAQLHAQGRHFKEAIGMYEDLANITMQNNASGKPVLGRLEVKEYFFRAVLCHLAYADQTSGIDRLAGIEKAKRAFDRYSDLDLEGFNTGAEYLLAQKLIDAALHQNLAAMQKAIRMYEESRIVDPTVQRLLDKIVGDLEAWLDRVGEGL